MRSLDRALHRPPAVAQLVRKRIERAGERIWRLEDFCDLRFQSVAQALSRLVKAGVIERLSKGVYYRSRSTALGKSRPNPSTIQLLASRGKAVFPSGTAAASLLGFTTQNASRGEVSTSASSLPRKLIGQETVVHTRRPESWARLSQTEAALLDFLRHGGKTSELSPGATLQRTLKLLKEPGRYDRLLNVAGTEPPRVRALLGALGEQLGRSGRSLAQLRASLNQLSRFDFGMLSGLRGARAWQAKEQG